MILLVSLRKRKGAIQFAKINKFVDRINARDLLDLGVEGTKYVGSIMMVTIFKRLDRAMSNDSWGLRFPNAYVHVLARVEYL